MPTPNKIFLGVDTIGGNTAASYRLPYNDTKILDASSGDADTPANWDNCRGISVDVSGIVKITYTNLIGEDVVEVKQLNAGVQYSIRNVKTLSRYYTGTTAGTAKAFGTDGVLITNAIKIHR